MFLRLCKKLIRLWQCARDPVRYARNLGVTVGQDCRLIAVNDTTFGSEPFLIRIGNHVTVAAGVRFITHDGGVDVLRLADPNLDVVAPITIHDNVFVGTNAILLPGVTIGKNCVIGAGAVVARDIPAGHVAVGVPARCVKTIEEYQAKVLAGAFRTRSLPLREKQELWKSRYAQNGGTATPNPAVESAPH